MSARLSSVSASSPSSGYTLMPMLTVMWSSWPASVCGRARAAMIFCAPIGRILRVLQLRQHDHEFVAAMPADGVGAPDAHRHFPCDGSEQLVAEQVPERVVDVLEAIDIEKEDRQPPLVALGQRKRAGQPVGQQQAVRQIGQRIVARQMGQLQRRLLGVPPEVILPQQRVAEHLQQLAVEHQPPRRDRLLPSRHGPQFLEGRPALAGEPRDRHRFTKSDQRVAGHTAPDNVPVEQKRDADHRQARRPVTTTAGRWSTGCARHCRTHSANTPGS